MCNQTDQSTINCQLDNCVYFTSNKLARLFKKTAEEAFRKTGLSPSHAMLLYIVNKEGRIHQKIAGEFLHMTPSTMTRFVDKLVHQQLVSRSVDGKNVYLQTTTAGLERQKDILSSWTALHQTYENLLSDDETRQFLALSHKLLDGLENASEHK